jgi:hypothetical protein
VYAKAFVHENKKNKSDRTLELLSRQALGNWRLLCFILVRINLRMRYNERKNINSKDCD